MITAMLGGNAEAWAQTTSYVLNISSQDELNTIETGPTLELSGPGSTLTFEACKSPASVNGLYIETSNDGSSWIESSEINVKANSINWKLQEIYNWTPYSYTIPNVNVRYIRFKTKTGATLTKYYKNIKVTRATTLATSISSIDFVPIAVNTSSTKQASISFNNTTYPQQVTGTCTNGYFTITSKSVDATGDTTIDVKYNPQQPGEHKGTVTLSMNGKEVSFTVFGASLATYNFSAQASPNNANYGSASASVDKATITSANASETATATFTATAKEGYEFVGWGTSADATSYESTSNPYRPTISNSAHATTATKTLYAIFRPVFKFSVAAEKIYDYGTVSATVTDKILGEPSATSLSTKATFTASPKTGATFEGWYSDREHTQLVSKDAT